VSLPFNSKNLAVVTCQENNHIVLVDLPSGAVVGDFPAGTADLDEVDVDEEDLIDMTGTLLDVPREPDGVAWIGQDCIATADEGDLDGGSRGFTIFQKDGTVLLEAGARFEHLAFQREWVGDPAGKIRIGCYGTASGAWTFAYYPRDAVESPQGGWVGLSELTWLGGDRFLVVERDNQAGEDARVKRLYEISIAGVVFVPEGGAFPTLTKALVRDLMPDLRSPKGAVIEKVEGCCVLANGDVVIVTDNDGVEDSNGETQFLHLGKLLK